MLVSGVICLSPCGVKAARLWGRGTCKEIWLPYWYSWLPERVANPVANQLGVFGPELRRRCRIEEDNTLNQCTHGVICSILVVIISYTLVAVTLTEMQPASIWFAPRRSAEIRLEPIAGRVCCANHNCVHCRPFHRSKNTACLLETLVT